MLRIRRIQPKFVKFNLPDFNKADPETWFVSVEVIFEANKIVADAERFSYILQHIDSAEFSHLRDILASTGNDKDVKTEQRLIQIHGKTRSEKLIQLLQGAIIPTDCKPSIILAAIKLLVGAGADSDEMKDMIACGSRSYHFMPEKFWHPVAINRLTFKPKLRIDCTIHTS